jgi:translation initiation factor IF-3
LKLISKRDIKITREEDSAKAQVISELGENLGEMSLEVAFNLAESKSLDLAIISDGKNSKVPIVKMLDYSKKVYNEKKKRTLAKKVGSKTIVKELRISPRIGENELIMKAKKAVEFLEEGHRVQVVMKMRGRERGLKNTFGTTNFKRLEAFLKEASYENNKTVFIENESDGSWSWSKTYFLKK